jgi:hypothetical protein
MNERLFAPTLNELAQNVKFDLAERDRALRLLSLISHYGGRPSNDTGEPDRQSLAALHRYIDAHRSGRPHTNANDFLADLQAVVDRLKSEVLAPHVLPGVRSKEAVDWRQRAESTRVALLSLSSLPDEITMLTNGDYHTFLLNAFAEAQLQIVVAVSQIAVTSFQKHPTQALIGELGRAITRGVDVNVFTSEPTGQGTAAKPHRLALDALDRAGVRLHARRSSTPFHYKAVVIDKLISIVGSHNWTFPALQQNHELSIAIRGPEFATQTLTSIARGFTR